MLTVVTGAAAFVGQALVRLMAERGGAGPVRLVDREEPSAPDGFIRSICPPAWLR